MRSLSSRHRKHTVLTFPRLTKREMPAVDMDSINKLAGRDFVEHLLQIQSELVMHGPTAAFKQVYEKVNFDDGFDTVILSTILHRLLCR